MSPNDQLITARPQAADYHSLRPLGRAAGVDMRRAVTEGYGRAKDELSGRNVPGYRFSGRGLRVDQTTMGLGICRPMKDRLSAMRGCHPWIKLTRLEGSLILHTFMPETHRAAKA